MGASSRWRHEVAAHPQLVDVVLAAAVLALTLVQPGQKGDHYVPVTAASAALAVVACSALVVRRRWPVPVLLVTLLASLAYVMVVGQKSPIGLSVAIASYTVVLSTEQRTWIWFCIATAVLGSGVAILFTGGGVLDSLGLAVVILLAVAVGEAVRNRRAYVAAIEERAIRAEQSREEEAHRRVIEERLRIAHELHDVIAHHIALMNVQAGVAAHVLRDRPGEAEQAIGHVRASGRTVLRELTMLLDVLRDEGETALPTEPLPSVRRLGELVGSFTAAGLDVDWHAYDELLPATVDLVAYRVVQESLTNVFKHAPGARVRVAITRTGGTLCVSVTDDGGPPASTPNGAGSGHGLLGMRERVLAVGGTFEAGPAPGGGFRVNAELPVDDGREGDAGDDPGAAGRRPDADPQRVPGAGLLGARSGGCR